MIHLDGSYLEGGGQIVRTALALSTITGMPFNVMNIRKGRSRSGLKYQHVKCVEALQQLCDAEVIGCKLHSTELTYTPKILNAKSITIDIGTAGSITLLLQSLLLPLFFSGKKTITKIVGGTDVDFAMPIDYFRSVLLPQLKPFCKKIECNIISRGYTPKGGGEIELKITPLFSLNNTVSFEDFRRELKESGKIITLTHKGTLQIIRGVSHTSQPLQSRKVSERQAEATRAILSRYNVPLRIIPEYTRTLSVGSGITLWAEYTKKNDILPHCILGGSALGHPRKTSEQVGRLAANNLLESINTTATVDKHLADNLLPFMALFSPSTIIASEITTHTRTNIYVIEKFLGKKIFKIEGNSITSSF